MATARLGEVAAAHVAMEVAREIEVRVIARVWANNGRYGPGDLDDQLVPKKTDRTTNETNAAESVSVSDAEAVNDDPVDMSRLHGVVVIWSVAWFARHTFRSLCRDHF